VAELVITTGRGATVVVSSFWPETLDAVRRSGPAIPTGLLVAPWFDPVDAVAAASPGAALRSTPPPPGERGARGRGPRRRLSVAAWTVNDTDSLRAMEGLGVDRVITDDVPRALSALGRR